MTIPLPCCPYLEIKSQLTERRSRRRKCKLLTLERILSDILYSVGNEVDLHLLRELHDLNARCGSGIFLWDETALNEHSPTSVASDEDIDRLIALVYCTGER